MQNVKVEVKVSLPSGASIGLTNEQLNNISGFVTKLLFNEPEKVKKTYTRRRGSKAWTAEEDALITPLLFMTSKTERTKYYKKIKRQINRGSGSIYTRVFNLKKLYPTTEENNRIKVTELL